MGYSINLVENFGPPFQVVHEQVVLAPAQGFLPVQNRARKILFVLSGECRHQVVGARGAGADVRLRAGDVLALPHRCEQRYHGLEPGSASRLHVIRLSFDPEQLPLLSLAPHSGSGKPLPRPADSPDAPGVRDVPLDLVSMAEACLREIRYVRGGTVHDAVFQETLTHLRDEARLGAPGYRLRVHSLCAGLIVLLYRKLTERIMTSLALESETPAPEFHVGKIKDYIRGHRNRQPRLAEVADHVGLTEEYTARLFKKVTGMTLSEYGRRLRVSDAQNLLTTTERNLGEIARATGFASLTVFSRNFKREVGVTPTEFRQRLARQMG